MATLSQKVALAGDAAFKNRVKAAVAEYAFAVLGEVPADTTVWSHRGALAARALEDIDDVSGKFFMAMATHDTVADAGIGANGSAGISDALIRGAVAQIWNQMAGVNQASD